MPAAPLPDNLDGRVLNELFKPGRAEHHRVTTQPAVVVTARPASPNGDIEAELHAVGYLR